MTSAPLPVVLTAYGLPHVMGYLATQDGERPASPLSLIGLMETAQELGLAGVEIDLWSSKTLSEEEIHDALVSRGLRLVADYGAIVNTDAETIHRYLQCAAKMGAKTVRAVLSAVLCGKRGSLPEGWDARMEAVAHRLREILPLAEDLGLCIAMENHQDATTDDLLRLHDMTGNSPAYGVTLDAGNPLAVGEGPVEAARRLGPLIRHLHMKDYTIHFAPEGYRLVRCAAGDGCVDFPALLEIVRSNGQDVLPGIEIGAQPTRTIPALDDDWWMGFPPEQRSHFPSALRVLWQHGRPMDEPYSSAWERGEDSATVSAEEWDIVHRSSAYFHSLFKIEASTDEHR